MYFISWLFLGPALLCLCPFSNSTASCLKIIVYVWVFVTGCVWTLNPGSAPLLSWGARLKWLRHEYGTFFIYFRVFPSGDNLLCTAPPLYHLSTSLYSGELRSLGAGRWINQICRRLSTPAPLQWKGVCILLSKVCCCPIVHSSVPVSILLSTPQWPCLLSAGPGHIKLVVGSDQDLAQSPGHTPLTPHINIAVIRRVFQYWIAIILLRFLVTQFQLQETRYDLVYVLGCRRLWAIGSIVISAAIEKDVVAWPEDARRLSTL